MKELIQKYLREGVLSIPINYRTSTTSDNGEVIDIFMGSEKVATTDTDGLGKFTDDLKAALPDHLNAVERRIEFHFYHPGFNSGTARTVIVELSKAKKTKPGIKKLELTLIGYKEAMEAIGEYPDYELYLRRGLGYRGAQEQRSTIQAVEKALLNCCCADLTIVDDEIHVNTFSTYDME